MNEKKFKNDFVKLLEKEMGLNCYRIENKISPGMPDLLILNQMNQGIFAECKIDGYQLNKYQKIWIMKHVKKGGIAWLISLMKPVFYIDSASINENESLQWDPIYWELWPLDLKSPHVRKTFFSLINQSFLL